VQALASWLLRLAPVAKIRVVPPQFIPQGQPLITSTFGLVSIHVVIGVLWSAFLISAACPLSVVMQRKKVIAWMDRCTGTLFVLFAVRLALSRR
jgi:threonine/homoserine/homoserine lactone efflux protein